METEPITFAARAVTPPPPGGEHTDLAVGGMTCANCVRQAREALEAVPGVRSATVSLEEASASVRWQPGTPPEAAPLLAAVRKAGFSGAVRTAPEAAGQSAPRRSGWEANLWIGALCTVPLMVGDWVFHLGMTPWFHWVSFVLATVVQFGAGARFYRGAWRQLWARNANMDTLVALGSSTAYAYSVWILFTGQHAHTYFMEAAAIITLISVGHWVEARAGARAAAALRKLVSLAPATARRLQPAGRAGLSAEGQARAGQAHMASEPRPSSQTISFGRPFRPPRLALPEEIEVEVPVAALRVGDKVLVKPGDRVPLDGRVVEGASAVDESVLTGEAMAVEKRVADLVYGGTMNQNGRLVVRVTATGEATALAHIIEAVQRAQNSRASIQRLGDRVSSVFVPLVVLMALGTALWWGFHYGLGEAVAHAAAVLIVACPCAMGLATPVAIMAGTNAAAQRGILIRDGVALEKAGSITCVVFDKTGTLTQGKPAVVATQVFPVDGAGVDTLGLAGVLARSSNHPLSRAVAAMGSGTARSGRVAPVAAVSPVEPGPFELTEWEEVRGAGVQARVKPRGGPPRDRDVQLGLARLGSLPWLQSQGVSTTEGEAFIAEWSGQGATVLGLALDQRFLGMLAVRDIVKPQAAEVITELRQRGYALLLATGDNARTAAAIARQVGLRPEDVRAQMRPEEKAAWVEALQAQGHKVAFIGDGINDAPALQRANLGIAVCAASDLASESADLVLLKSELQAVPEALALAQFTLRVIKQNLFWAFFYNAASIPLAALGFMSPVLCAAAMGLSDLMVIGNALRLLRWRRGHRSRRNG